MCGLAGIVAFPPQPPDADALRRIWRALEHRGPDDRGCLASRGRRVVVTADLESLLGRIDEGETAGEPEALLLHHRLSILDLSPAGRQPMSTPDGRWHLVLNGEIYNYLEIEEELRAAGVVFRSSSDSEVLLRAWERWEHDLLPRLVGMFAFAVLDLERRRLTLARDIFGIKPLYWAARGGTFAFASEIKALLELPWVSREANPQALFDYLRLSRSDHGEATFFRSIQQLPAASWMEIDLDRPDRPCVARGYWSPPTAVIEDLSFEEAAQQLRQLFLRSVELHLRSDVPVGAALSGGIDSSSVVAAMRQLAGAPLELHAFSFLPSDHRLSEERWIRTASTANEARLHTVTVAPGDLAADLDRLVQAQDQPFGSTSIYAQARVFRLARETGITVVLDGQGADELLGGYGIHKAARLLSLLRHGRFAEALRLLRWAGSWGGPRPAWLLEKALAAQIPPGWDGALRALAGRDRYPPWMNARWFRRQGVRADLFRLPGGREPFRSLLAECLSVSPLPGLLRFEDRNSMSVSVEGRVPFLNPRLAEFVLALPESHLVGPAGESKRVLRRAMRGIVPDVILDRRDKVAFLTPEGDWLRASASWIDGVLGERTSSSFPFLNLPRLRDRWKNVREGRVGHDPDLWRAVNTMEWMRVFGVTLGDGQPVI